MKTKKILLIILIISTYTNSFAQALSAEEKKLYDMLMQYRKENGLSSIPLSRSLTFVAQTHVKDLVEKMGYLTHAWSSCEYDSGNRNTYECMWLKPRELTNYNGYGYECAHGGPGGYVATALSSFNSWKNSAPHNAVILNQSIWANNHWKAIGVGILNGYACIWFGEDFDNN